MPLKYKNYPLGELVRIAHVSKVLKGNQFKDPIRRDLMVWLPPGYSSTTQRYPVVYDLAGFTSAGPARLNWKPFAENMKQRLERLTFEETIGSLIVVFPDCFTSLGGNQYVNSSALGSYDDYLIQELVPFVDKNFRTKPSAKNRACFGKSSGGYGAMLQGMKHPDVWGAIGNLSGDAYFDFIYRRDWPNTLDTLAKFTRTSYLPVSNSKREILRRDLISQGVDDGRMKRFLNSVWSREKITFSEGHCLMSLCMAASYDPDPSVPLGFKVPFDMDTGELIPSRWRRWLAHDPIHLAERYEKNLKKLGGLWIECGTSDQYFIHYGTRILSKKLHGLKVNHTYEEFDDNHSDLDYRLDRVLPFLFDVIR